MILPIVTTPNLILTTKTAVVTEFDAALHQLLSDMRETMHGADGLGIAAPQVGVSAALCVLEFTDPDGEESIPLTELVNPRITWRSARTEVDDEACLSIPAAIGPVRRAVAIKVEAQDRHGEPITLEADGLFARALQHEIDHLNGILFTDHVPSGKLRTRIAPSYPTA
jgi:peptide deformylase